MKKATNFIYSQGKRKAAGARAQNSSNRADDSFIQKNFKNCVQQMREMDVRSTALTFSFDSWHNSVAVTQK